MHFLFSLAITLLLATAHAHGDEKSVWALNKAEQAQLLETLTSSQRALTQALAEATSAAQFGSSRDYLFDSNQETANIPRSVLNRVIQHSLELETAQMHSYLFCESGCTQSARLDGLSDIELKTARGLWPKIRASFALLFKEIPHGVWLRTIHFIKYSRSIGAKYHYQKAAYGRFALLAGASAFGGAFVATEIAESMFMGPLHIVCQANYLWSVAFASSVSSLSRDIKTVLGFNAKNESFLKRLFGAYGRYSLIRRERALEDRILLNSMTEKLTRRQAQIQHLTPILEAELELPIRRSVAADGLLWAELLSPSRFHSNRETPALSFSKYWQSEFEELKKLSPQEVRLWWHDLHASLRTLLRLKAFHLQTEHTFGLKQRSSLQRLGALDRSLRTWDTIVLLSLKTENPVGSWTDENTNWLRDITGEWLALLISIEDIDTKAIEVRQRYLEELMNIPNRHGGLSADATALPATDRIAKAAETRILRLCDGAFVSMLPVKP